MDLNPKPLTVHWRWFKVAAGVFIPAPAFFAFIASWVLWTSGGTDTKLPAIVQIWLAVAWLAIFLFCFGERLGIRASESRLAGIGIGALALVVLVVGFVVGNMFTATNSSVRSAVLLPAFWLSVFGLPFAAFSGFVFSGLARNEVGRVQDISDVGEDTKP